MTARSGAFFDARWRTTMPRMAKTDQAVELTLTLPEHVVAVLDGWAASDLQATPEEALEALADALCTNEELRQYAASLLRD